MTNPPREVSRARSAAYGRELILTIAGRRDSAATRSSLSVAAERVVSRTSPMATRRAIAFVADVFSRHCVRPCASRCCAPAYTQSTDVHCVPGSSTGPSWVIPSQFNHQPAVPASFLYRLARVNAAPAPSSPHPPPPKPHQRPILNRLGNLGDSVVRVPPLWVTRKDGDSRFPRPRPAESRRRAPGVVDGCTHRPAPSAQFPPPIGSANDARESPLPRAVR